ncbi:hypothetical protein PV327_002397 [Microctonus hyperodae]|uniref:RING-type E3 ubiquitin transferase n=1 Tax=Microctonus hyperodae TaxID=165561 RepID=A0AA39FFW8_MICHY|nr:hypothetical protein PV327_002397 [Microctonus hyperodae]
MADNWARNIICRYYKNGLCREGENCTYRHERSQSVASTSGATASGGDITPDLRNSESNEISPDGSSIVGCRFFKWGTCKFDKRCRFGHGTTQRESTSENEPQQQNVKKTRLNSSSTATTSTHAAHSSSASCTSSSGSSKKSKKTNYEADEWVKAPEFVPYSTTSNENLYSDCDMVPLCGRMPQSYARIVSNTGQSSNPASEPLCPDAAANGICKLLDCHFLHGDICDMCGRAALHPYNKQQSQQHTSECVKQHEADMELSFAVQRSRDKTCGVCFEIVMEKSSREQRFGILPNCNHCFCLSCIRKWRQAKQFDNKIIRSCPECRVTSDFVCPSTYWVDTKEEKEKLIVEYKVALGLKDCKYFNKGQGKCPFGNKCFYLHALPDGTKTDVGPPARQSSEGDRDLDFLQQQLILWRFLEERDNRLLFMDDHDEVVVLFSDSDDSDWSRFGPHD